MQAKIEGVISVASTLLSALFTFLALRLCGPDWVAQAYQAGVTNLLMLATTQTGNT